MKTGRRIEMVVNHMKAENEDRADVVFWLGKSPAKRLAKVVRLRRNYFMWTESSFPRKIEKVVQLRPL